jgi:hypothetical protein
VDQELHHELRPHGVEHHRRAAKALLRAVHGGDAPARARAHAPLGERARERFVLADALHVLAVEHGFSSWPAFKRDVEACAGAPLRLVGRIGAWLAERYEEWATRLLGAARRGEADAVARLRAHVPRVAGDDETIAGRARSADARICLAREYGFRTWAELLDAAERACRTHTTAGWRPRRRGGRPRPPSRRPTPRRCATAATVSSSVCGLAAGTEATAAGVRPRVRRHGEHRAGREGDDDGDLEGGAHQARPTDRSDDASISLPRAGGRPWRAPRRAPGCRRRSPRA